MKDSMELMRQRHSVRQYLDKKIPAEIRPQAPREKQEARPQHDCGGR